LPFSLRILSIDPNQSTTVPMTEKTGIFEGVEALLFDVFGTVVDWLGSMERILKENGKGTPTDWNAFAKRWRKGYMTETRRIAAGGEGPSSVDEMHRQILDEMLKEPEWKHLSQVWNEEDKVTLVQGWHKLNGWPDSSRGLYELKKKYLICTLSNGNVRLLADMAKISDLPWDIIFSGELLGSYKPNPMVYLGGAYHLSLDPSKCALVAAHIEDLQAAERCGYRSVYVRRETEDIAIRDSVRARSAGSQTQALLKDGTTDEKVREADVVVDSFIELAEILGC